MCRNFAAQFFSFYRADHEGDGSGNRLSRSFALPVEKSCSFYAFMQSAKLWRVRLRWRVQLRSKSAAGR